jgi:hypothetical protein
LSKIEDKSEFHNQYLLLYTVLKRIALKVDMKISNFLRIKIKNKKNKMFDTEKKPAK